MNTPIFNCVLLKVASRCNINCSYCYWFRDPSVYEKPAILEKSVEETFFVKLEEHIRKHAIEKFTIILHGGEPLLYGKHNFYQFAEKSKILERKTNCEIALSTTTNGIMIDDEWASVFRYFGISVTVSVDSTKESHDKYRVDFKKRGTYDRVVKGINTLKKFGIEPGILGVCDPSQSPQKVYDHYVNELGLSHFDLLIPDFNHENKIVPSVAKFYKELFDIWFLKEGKNEVEIRTLKSIIHGLLGGETKVESFGYGPIQTLTMLTDGSLEPLDVLRAAGYNSTKTNINIKTHTFQDVVNDKVWKEAFEASLNLPDKCLSCDYRFSCGGGYLPHRWSKENRYHNPTVYCEDMIEIFDHAWNRIKDEVYIETSNEKIKLSEIEV